MTLTRQHGLILSDYNPEHMTPVVAVCHMLSHLSYFFRCMSIPVTLYAVLKCPQLLEGNAAFVFQKYQQSLHDFDSELSSRSEKSRGSRLKLGGGAAAKEQHGLMDVGDWRYGGNLKRKRTD